MPDTHTVIVHGNYNMDLKDVFADNYKPDAPDLRFGTEVEVGFKDFNKRDAFLTALEQADLADYLCSKHDGSVQGGYTSEIVSRPLDFETSRRIMRQTGVLVEDFSLKGMTLQGAAVHVHVTKKAVPTQIWWRIAQAITPSADLMSRWSGARGAKRTMPDMEPYEKTYGALPKDLREYLEAQEYRITKFWDLVALRKAGDYRVRKGWGSVDGFLKHKSQHGAGQHAIQPGKTTPTIEFRLFRAARERQVLTSYVECTAALIEYCQDYGDKKGWVDGVFPVDAFVKYVLDHGTQWPALARRLSLPKFDLFRLGKAEAKLNYEGHVGNHDDIRLGCLLRDDTMSDPSKTVFVVDRLEPDTDDPYICRMRKGADADSYYLGDRYSLRRASAIHVCPGAATVGVFE